MNKKCFSAVLICLAVYAFSACGTVSTDESEYNSVSGTNPIAKTETTISETAETTCTTVENRTTIKESSTAYTGTYTTFEKNLSTIYSTWPSTVYTGSLPIKTLKPFLNDPSLSGIVYTYNFTKHTFDFVENKNMTGNIKLSVSLPEEWTYTDIVYTLTTSEIAPPDRFYSGFYIMNGGKFMGGIGISPVEVEEADLHLHFDNVDGIKYIFSYHTASNYNIWNWDYITINKTDTTLTALTYVNRKYDTGVGSHFIDRVYVYENNPAMLFYDLDAKHYVGIEIYDEDFDLASLEYIARSLTFIY